MASYLADVKAELNALVDQAAEQDADIDSLKKELWLFLEAKLKESFANGKKANGNGKARAEADASPEAPRRKFSFRK